VGEDGTVGEQQQFSQELFERVCNLPHLTEMELLFIVEDARLEPLKKILGEIVLRSESTPGIRAVFLQSPGGFNEEGIRESAKLAILVNITRPPFGGFQDGDDDNEEMIDNTFDEDLD